MYRVRLSYTTSSNCPTQTLFTFIYLFIYILTYLFIYLCIYLFYPANKFFVEIKNY